MRLRKRHKPKEVCPRCKRKTEILADSLISVGEMFVLLRCDFCHHEVVGWRKDCTPEVIASFLLTQ